ncbi:FAD-binding protein [Clostridium sp. MB05]
MREIDYSGLTGEVIKKGSSRYEESIISWNRAIKKYPLVVIYCHNEDDVVNSIVWAKNNSIEIKVRSGTHSYEGYSTGNDVAVIDISRINKIYIDEKEEIVKIGGGVRNREIYEALGSRGYAFPGGGCPTVGVPGLILGGGWGYSSRFLGLACDSLIEAELINYEGKKLLLNENLNSDLFWACKGSGGGNFGIITSMTLQLKEKIKMGTLININYPNISNKDNIKVVEVLQHLYKSLDRRINLKTAIYNSAVKGRGVKITGLFYGNDKEALNILKSLKEIVDNVEFDLKYMTVLECNRWIQDSHPDYEKYKSTGRFVYKDYSANEIKAIIELVDNPAEGAVYSAVSFYGAGGAISDVNKLDTAFYYRDAKFIMGLQSVWENDIYEEENKEWVRTKFNTVKELTVGSFVNFPLAELENYEKEYYGEHMNSLRKIKIKYDPYNVFKFPQVIKREK